MVFDSVFESFGRAFIPRKFREPLREYLLTAGYDNVPYKFYGSMFVLSLVITTILHLVLLVPRMGEFSTTQLPIIVFVFWVLAIGLLSVLVMFFIWSFLSLRIYNRTKQMEKNLPDYLSLVVTNLRSGMSFEKSLWAAIRPEFGVLATEIAMVSKKVMTGNDATDALKEYAMRYNSPILRRSMNLIISEIESGGEIASVIDKVIDNLRKTQQLKNEMAASVVSYMMFIAIIVMVLSPVLFALANTILQVILGFAEQIALAPSGGAMQGGAANLFNSLSALAKTGDQLTSDFRIFSYLALATISMFAGMIISIIEKGDIRGGLKYIPVFLSITLLLFWIADGLLIKMFGNII